MAIAELERSAKIKMTNLDVVDSAVKIGLGALITALAAIATTVIRGRHERKTEVRKRRFDLIERITGEFEQVHSVFIELYSSYATYLNCPNRLAAEMKQSKVQDSIVNKVGPSLISLHAMEGRLMLIGAKRAVTALVAYRIAATNLQNEVRIFGGSEGAPPTGPQWEHLGTENHACRSKFFEALRMDYENA